MRPAATLVLVALCCVVAAGAAWAQGRPAPSRPARGGATTLSANVFGGYDAPLFATDSFATLVPSGQGFGGADAAFGYGRTGRRVAFSVNLGANTSYFPRFKPKTQPAYGGSVTLSSTTAGRWNWGLSGFAHYAPLSNTGLFAGAGGVNGQAFTLASGTGFQVSTVRQVDTSGTASLAYSPTRRTHVQVMAGAGAIVPIDGAIADNVRLNGTVRLARDITRNFRGYIGYAVMQNRAAAFGGQPATSTVIDGIDFGVDFARPFQITRNTTMSFATGLVNVPDSGSGRRGYQLVGNVALDHQFRRTWTATLAVSRDARFVQSFKDPVLSTSASASAGGSLSGNLGATLSANYSRGSINSPGVKSAFVTYSASARLRYDLRRLVATFAEYALFRSDIGVTSALQGYPTGAFGRHSIRAGLSFGLNPFRSLMQP